MKSNQQARRLLITVTSIYISGELIMNASWIILYGVNSCKSDRLTRILEFRDLGIK